MHVVGENWTRKPASPDLFSAVGYDITSSVGFDFSHDGTKKS
jgi:hypothetical protein